MLDILLDLANHIIRNPSSLPPEAVLFYTTNYSKFMRRPYQNSRITVEEACFQILVYAIKKFDEIQVQFQAAAVAIDSGSDLKTQVYAFVNNLPGTRCRHNGLRKLKKFDSPLLYCGTNGACQCQMEDFQAHCANKSTQDKAAIRIKRQATNEARFGVPNAMQSPDIVERLKTAQSKRTEQDLKDTAAKRRATTIDRLGVENAFQSEAIKAKISTTMMDRYGVSNPAQLKQFRDKAADTLELRTGFRSVLANPAVISATQASNAKQKDLIQAKIRETTFSHYGVEYGFLQPTDKTSHTQDHYSELTKQTLFDSNRLKQFMLTRSLLQAAEQLGIHKATLWTYCRKAGIVFDRNRSTYEVEIEAFLQSNGLKYLKNSRKIIPPQELDFFLPDQQIGIEFNGLYYHSDSPRGKEDPKYHYNKMRSCEKAGVRLISINEDEWIERKSLVCGRILNVCGLSERGPGARKLVIAETSVAEAQKFTAAYHMQGKSYNAFYAVGAYADNRLVGVLTFSKQRGTQTVELSRFCSDGKIYAGLFTRLFAFACKQKKFSEVVTYADRRYSQGQLYFAAGFKHNGNCPVDYRYVRGSKTYHKQYLTKTNIAKKFKLSVEGQTESELSKQLGFHRIYDCGKMRFKWIDRADKSE